MTLKNKPIVILVNTQLPENLGATARSMLNFEIDDESMTFFNVKNIVLNSPYSEGYKREEICLNFTHPNRKDRKRIAISMDIPKTGWIDSEFYYLA